MKPIARSRVRHEQWDILAELFFEPRTDTECRAFGKVADSLKRAGATADEIKESAERYKKTWPDSELTMYALEKWFSHFLVKAKKKTKAKASVCEECEMGGGHHIAGCSRAKEAV